LYGARDTAADLLWTNPAMVNGVPHKKQSLSIDYVQSMAWQIKKIT